MKKVIKKIFTTIGVFIVSIYTKILKVYATGGFSDMDLIEPLYGIMEPEPISIINKIWKVTKIIIIPIVLLVGSIVYFKKSTSSVKKKIIIILIALIMVVLFCFGMNAILGYLVY